jgi:hypothetical protein
MKHIISSNVIFSQNKDKNGWIQYGIAHTEHILKTGTGQKGYSSCIMYKSTIVQNTL